MRARRPAQHVVARVGGRRGSSQRPSGRRPRPRARRRGGAGTHRSLREPGTRRGCPMRVRSTRTLLRRHGRAASSRTASPACRVASVRSQDALRERQGNRELRLYALACAAIRLRCGRSPLRSRSPPTRPAAPAPSPSRSSRACCPGRWPARSSPSSCSAGSPRELGLLLPASRPAHSRRCRRALEQEPESAFGAALRTVAEPRGAIGRGASLAAVEADEQMGHAGVRVIGRLKRG